MQLQFWAKNLASGSTTDIALSRPLYLTNISISSERSHIYAPTSLMMSVVLGEQTSPFYTVATLIAGSSNTFHINVRLDQGVKYVLKVNGPNMISVLGYHPQGIKAGPQSTQNFRTFVRPAFTNRTPGLSPSHGAHLSHGSASNAGTPGIIISPPVTNGTQDSSNPVVPGSVPGPQTLSDASVNNGGQTQLNRQVDLMASNRQLGQANNPRPDALVPPQNGFTASGPQRFAFQVPNSDRMEHKPQQQYGYMGTSSNDESPAVKKVKGEDGHARRQSLPSGSRTDGFERAAGSGSNKRKATDNPVVISNSSNAPVAPSGSYPRPHISLPPSNHPVASSSNVRLAPPGSYSQLPSTNHPLAGSSSAHLTPGN
ncbi:hypothetical protein F5879DRAFT_991087 [Lentinula edodes]|nr:hypothetical protein F5879DRAFT_991087 [Lentinula edodes]